MLASQDAQKRHSEVAANTIDGCPRVPPRSRMSRSVNSSSAVRDMLGSDGPLLVSSCDHLSGVISFHDDDHRHIAFGRCARFLHDGLRWTTIINKQLRSETTMTEERRRFDIRMWNDSRLIVLSDVIPAVRSDGLRWVMSDAWVTFREGAPHDILRIVHAAEKSQVPVEWSAVEELARWSTQCIDLTLRGYESPDNEEPVIEIVAFDSTTWELAVNDPSRANMHLPHGLGGRWVLANERGEAQAPADA